MDKKTLGYSAFLLFGLIIVSVLLNRGVIQGLDSDAHVSLTRSANQYLLGQTIVFNGTLTLPEGEATSSISRVRLFTSTGPQPLDVDLPVQPTGGFVDISNLTASTVDTLLVNVVFTDIATISGGTLPGGTMPGSTLPGSTLPGTGLAGFGEFKGTSDTATIAYEIRYTPGVQLEPPPVFTLITNGDTGPADRQRDVEFAIQPLIDSITDVSTTTDTALPDTDLVFAIPTVGQPSGTVLPNATGTVAIPDIQNLISTNAPATVPALRDITFADGGFNVPTVSVATSTVNDFPNSSAGFNIQPVAVVAAPSNVPDLPQVAQHFAVTSNAAPRGLATDGTDFWVVSDNTGSGGNDQILRFTSSGTATGTPITAPSDAIEGLAYLDNSLWVADNNDHCGDDINPFCSGRGHFIFEVPINNPPASGSPSDWSSLSNMVAPDNWASINGITVEGSGPTGSLWLAPAHGYEFYNMSQAGSQLSTVQTSGGASGMDSLALSGEFLYTSQGNSITQWTKTGSKVQTFSIVNEIGGAPINNITAMTFKPVSGKQVLFAGSTNDGQIYRGFSAESVTTNPVAMAFSPSTAGVGEALWMVLNGTPKDKIVKVDPSDGSFKTFGTAGATDAPNDAIDGMTFLSGFLWLVSNEQDPFSGGVRKLFKVSATNGSVQNTYDLGNQGIQDDIGAITTDGTNLILHQKSNRNQTYVFNTSGQSVSSSDSCCPEPSFQGATGMAYNTDREQYFVANNDKIAIYNSNKKFQNEWSISQSGGAAPTGIQGLAFDGRTLFIGHSGKVSKSFLASTVTTVPRGIAFTSGTTTSFGTAVYILVDASPTDKILKVDPADGSIITGGQFGTNGVADAPSGNTSGITFLNDFLWVVGSEGSGNEVTRKVYKINPSDGTLATSFSLSRADPVGGITNDSTGLLLFFEPWNEILQVSTTGQESGQTNPEANQTFGADAFAHHAGRSQYVAAQGSKMLILASDLRTVISERDLRLDGATFNGQVKGLTFNQDILYVAYTESGVGKVALGALKDQVTTEPEGIAFSPSGSTLSGASIGEALWAVVDGDPKDKILKLNPSTGALITTSNFPASTNDVGFIDAPSDAIEGVTFLGGYLWMVANEQSQFGGPSAKLYKVKATDGSLDDSFDISQNVYDVGGVTNDGSRIIVLSTQNDQVAVFDQSGGLIEQRPAKNLNGARGTAFRVGANQLLTVQGGQVLQFGVESAGYNLIAQFNTSLTNTQGMTFDTGASGDLTDDVLYVAHKDTAGRISRTGVPSDITNNPQGLTYDPVAGELYILVDGEGEAPDHVVVTSATSSTPIRDFDVPMRGEAEAITYLNGSLFVAIEESLDGGGQPPRWILDLDPSDGSQNSQAGVGQLDGKIVGLNNDGTSLIASTQYGGPHVTFLDPNSGNRQRETFFFDPTDFQGFQVEGFRGLAFDTSSVEFFPSKGKDIYRFDEDGRLIESFTIATGGVDNIQGAVFVGDQLYMAESNGDTVRKAIIPQPPTSLYDDPVGMTTDGTNLYIITDATPVDKILKVVASTGALVTSFGDGGGADAPGKDTEGIAYHNGLLYAVTNDPITIEICDQFGCNFEQRQVAVIHTLDPDTGDSLAESDIRVQTDGGGPDFLFDEVGALASDGVNLLVGLKHIPQGGQPRWFTLDPNDLDAPGQPKDQFQGQLPLMDGYDSLVVTTGMEFPANRQVIAAGDVTNSNVSDTLARFDNEGTMFAENDVPDLPGVVDGQFRLAGTDIKGMAYVSSSGLLYMADAGSAGGRVISTKLPENTGVELTIVGAYAANLEVSVGSNTRQDTTAPYSIIRNPQVIVQVTSPQDDFVLTDADATITGLINDPSIDELEVGFTLPFAKFVDDPVDSGSPSIWNKDSGPARWHIACQDGTPHRFPGPTRYSSAPCSWRYGVPDAPGFDTGQATQGSLTTNVPITVGGDTTLRFNTGYMTEPQADIDIKSVEVAIVTKDLQGNDQVGAFQPVLQIVGKGQGGPVPGNAWQGFQFIQLDPLFINPNLVPVEFDLSPFGGQRVMVRFRFDSVDEFGNEGEGWFLDDIVISGAGIKSTTVQTQMLSTPATSTVGTTTVTFYRSFTKTFTLSEGLNTVGAQAQQPYSPFLSDQDTVSGFVDTIAPVVSLSGLPAATNLLGHTLVGTFDEPTLVSLKVIQTVPDGTTSTILQFSQDNAPQDGTFQTGVSLLEGLNTFQVVVLDGGGRTGTATAQSTADLTAPTAQVGIVTVTSEGEAVGPLLDTQGNVLVEGDQYFVLVAATDALSGVATSTLVNTGQIILPISQTPAILREMHGLDAVGNVTTTNVTLAQVMAGTPVGLNTIPVRVSDRAGNTITISGNLNVVSERTNRNFYLFPGFNYMGLALIPDDGNPATTDDASLDRLMTQDVTDRVSQAFIDHMATSTVTLGDVVESSFAFNKAGNFIVHTPGDGAADTLTDLNPFQGMIVKTRESAGGTTTVDVFKKVSVPGFTASQAVPIRINIQGVFFRLGQLPPGKEMRVGYNLIAPHILHDTLFDTVYRGALIPKQLAVSALSFERRVDAVSDNSEISAEIFEGFSTNSLGDFLKPVLSYWTFIADDPDDVRVNDLGDQLGPTITP